MRVGVRGEGRRQRQRWAWEVRDAAAPNACTVVSAWQSAPLYALCVSAATGREQAHVRAIPRCALCGACWDHTSGGSLTKFKRTFQACRRGSSNARSPSAASG